MKNWFLLLFFLGACVKQDADSIGSFPVSAVATDSLTQTPFLFTDKSGNTYLSRIRTENDRSILEFATLQTNQEWSDASMIAEGSNWFVNWADYPILSSAQGSDMIAAYMVKSGESTYDYDIFLKISNDGGATWNAPFLLNEDGIPAEHGFVSMAGSGTDTFISWLDGRKSKDSIGAMTLRGAIFSRTGQRKGEWELDSRVCDCCQTATAVTANGPVVVYRDRSENEFRDISIVRFVNNKWTAPAYVYRDGWKIEGCPVNGPRIDALGNDLAISWFTGAKDKPSVRICFSSDGGATFSSPIELNTKPSIGRTDVVLLQPGKAFVSWMEGSVIMGAFVSEDGNVSKKLVVAPSSDARSSGFPQSTRVGDSILVAWPDSGINAIRTSFIPIN